MIGAVHITASGKILRASSVVRVVNAAKRSPHVWCKETFRSVFGGCGRDIVWEFRTALNDIINLRGGLDVSCDRKNLFQRLDSAVKAGKIVQSCKWCAESLSSDRYLQMHMRFCSDSCRRSYSC